MRAKNIMLDIHPPSWLVSYILKGNNQNNNRRLSYDNTVYIITINNNNIYILIYL